MGRRTQFYKPPELRQSELHPVPGGGEAVMDESRAQFEKAVIKHLGDERHVLRFPDNQEQYDSYFVEHLWWAWQAARSEQASPWISVLQRIIDECSINGS